MIWIVPLNLITEIRWEKALEKIGKDKITQDQFNQINQKLVDTFPDKLVSNYLINLVNTYWHQTTEELFFTYLDKFCELNPQSFDFKKYAEWIPFTEQIDALILQKQPLIKTNANGGFDYHDITQPGFLWKSDDDKCFLWKASSMKDCQRFGKGFPFCISRIVGGNMYWSYRIDKASTFYFLWNDNYIDQNEWITVLDHTDKEYEFTHKDNTTIATTKIYSASLDNFLQKFPEASGIKDLIVNTPLTEEEKKKYNFYKGIMYKGNFMQLTPLQKLEWIQMGFDIYGLVVWDREVLPKIGEIDLLNEWINMGHNIDTLQWFYLNKSYKDRWIKIREQNGLKITLDEFNPNRYAKGIVTTYYIDIIKTGTADLYNCTLDDDVIKETIGSENILNGKFIFSKEFVKTLDEDIPVYIKNLILNKDFYNKDFYKITFIISSLSTKNKIFALNLILKNNIKEVYNYIDFYTFKDLGIIKGIIEEYDTIDYLYSYLTTLKDKRNGWSESINNTIFKNDILDYLLTERFKDIPKLCKVLHYANLIYIMKYYINNDITIPDDIINEIPKDYINMVEFIDKNIELKTRCIKASLDLENCSFTEDQYDDIIKYTPNIASNVFKKFTQDQQFEYNKNYYKRFNIPYESNYNYKNYKVMEFLFNTIPLDAIKQHLKDLEDVLIDYSNKETIEKLIEIIKEPIILKVLKKVLTKLD